MDFELWTKKLYDHENLYCIESIIIVNQIKVFKFNSLTQTDLVPWPGSNSTGTTVLEPFNPVSKPCLVLV